MAPANWLVKSEPFKYSFDDLVRDGATYWDGVRNYPRRDPPGALA
jgi:predicted RNA-binding protein with PUA-like domain